MSMVSIPVPADLEHVLKPVLKRDPEDSAQSDGSAHRRAYRFMDETGVLWSHPQRCPLAKGLKYKARRKACRTKPFSWRGRQGRLTPENVQRTYYESARIFQEHSINIQQLFTKEHVMPARRSNARTPSSLSLFPIAQDGVPGVMAGKFTASHNYLVIKWLRWPLTRCEAAGFAVQYGDIPLRV